ncbi:hypothetical protein FALCPG4_014326 [Fusarium falciforme]
MSTLPPDPYKALGVSPDAQLPEIRSAHRKLVLKCHPDKVQDPTLKAQKQDEFQQVQQAYELLSDEKQRQKYDDQVRLQELREQMRAKVASSSSSRSTPSFKYEIRTNDRTYKTTSPSAKVFSYSRSYEDTDLRGADIFEGVRTVRREASYQGKPSRREERERDRDREIREREKERERERERRKKAEDAVRRAEKEAKEARRAEKKQKEKEKDKERKRESEEKKRHAKPYIETYDDEEPAPKSEKKKSSKKHDRDRSAHREEAPPATDSVPPPPMPSIPTEQSYEDKESEALKYINASRQQKKNPYARHMQPPAAPTPPPVGSPFAAPATPDDDVRRSSAKPRRGSSGEKAYKKKPSKEVLDDPIEVDVSPSGRPHVQKSATSTGILSGSPPRRTSTMPSDGYGGRPIPNLSRAQTYSGYPDVDSRGRNRSKMHAQIIESESEDEYERRRKERKHRSKKHRSPEPRGEHVTQYRVDTSGRTRLQNSFSRAADPEADAYGGYYSHYGERPSLSRDASYAHSPGYAQYDKYKTSKAYDYGDVQYSTYPTYREEYAHPTPA